MIRFNTPLIRMFGFIAFLFFMMTLPVYSGDGTIDILPDGKTSFMIFNPGSYVLVGDVTMQADVTCIIIKANDVTLDLNGHTITGLGSAASFQLGIAGRHRNHIRNGRITGFGFNGIELWDEARVEGVSVEGNGHSGVFVKNNSSLVRITSLHNGRYGIETGTGALVQDCIVEGNNLLGDCGGIYVNDGSLVKGCVCHNNSTVLPRSGHAFGIHAKNRCTLMENTCTSNTCNSSDMAYNAVGINASDFCLIENNTCIDNHVYGSQQWAIGIQAKDSCTISSNNCSRNTAYGPGCDARGISCMNHCRVEHNLTDNNSTDSNGTGDSGMGIQAGSDCTIRGNKCHQNSGKNFQSAGININGTNCRVEENHCTKHSSDMTGYGILVSGQDSVIVGNVTSNNKTKGIHFQTTGNYCGENMTNDGIDGTTGNTMGTDDRSNVAF